MEEPESLSIAPFFTISSVSEAITVYPSVKKFTNEYLILRVSPFTGLEEWTGLLDWNTGLYLGLKINLTCQFL